jgi:urease accessory protein
VGRDGLLLLRFARSQQSTVLAANRFTLPLQALRSVTLEDGTAYLMLLNPSGGVVGGDRLTTQIQLEPAAHACLTTPSATKVYRTMGAPAVQETTIELGAGAILEYIPDHVIPYASASLHQILRVEMKPGSRAIIADGFAAGRVGCGERWQFELLDSLITITSNGRPFFINRTKVTPATLLPNSKGRAQDFNYVASLLAFAEGWQEWEKLRCALDEKLASLPQISGGTSLLSLNGCIVRYLTKTAWELTQATRVLWGMTRRLLLGLEPFDLRKP